MLTLLLTSPQVHRSHRVPLLRTHILTTRIRAPRRLHNTHPALKPRAHQVPLPRSQSRKIRLRPIPHPRTRRPLPLRLPLTQKQQTPPLPQPPQPAAKPSPSSPIPRQSTLTSTRTPLAHDLDHVQPVPAGSQLGDRGACAGVEGGKWEWECAAGAVRGGG